MWQTLSPKADISSVGCVIAEVFLEGQCLFDHSKMLAYKERTYDPEVMIHKIPDKHVQKLIKYAVRLEPSQRKSATTIIMEGFKNVFPPYFEWLYQQFRDLLQPEYQTADKRIERIRSLYTDSLKNVCLLFSGIPWNP